MGSSKRQPHGVTSHNIYIYNKHHVCHVEKALFHYVFFSLDFCLLSLSRAVLPVFTCFPQALCDGDSQTLRYVYNSILRELFDTSQSCSSHWTCNRFVAEICPTSRTPTFKRSCFVRPKSVSGPPDAKNNNAGWARLTWALAAWLWLRLWTKKDKFRSFVVFILTSEYF